MPKVFSFDLTKNRPHVLVTGANTGMGFATVVELAKMGARVTLTARDAEKGAASVERALADAGADKPAAGAPRIAGLEPEGLMIRYLAVELSSMESMERAATALALSRGKAAGAADSSEGDSDDAGRHGGGKAEESSAEDVSDLEDWGALDVVVFNAGVMAVPDRRETADGFELQNGVNWVAAHYLTRLLEPQLADGGRLIYLSSIGHKQPPGQPKTTMRWEDPFFEEEGSYHPWNAYGQSKLGNNFCAQAFGERLRARKIVTSSVDPGGVNTDLARHVTGPMAVLAHMKPLLSLLGIASPTEGARTRIRLASDPDLDNLDNTGAHWCSAKLKTASELARGEGNGKRAYAIIEAAIEAKLRENGRTLTHVIRAANPGLPIPDGTLPHKKEEKSTKGASKKSPADGAGKGPKKSRSSSRKTGGSKKTGAA